MSTATHYENANFLRELAENLPRIWPNGTPAKTELLQRLADEELAQAQHEEWVRAKVAAASVTPGEAGMPPAAMSASKGFVVASMPPRVKVRFVPSVVKVMAPVAVPPKVIAPLVSVTVKVVGGVPPPPPPLPPETDWKIW